MALDNSDPFIIDQDQRCFQILSLDGGGIKGLFSAAILAHFEDDLNVKITDYFDLIVGTSTGGIIALALGVDMSPKDIVHFYVNEARNIFAGNSPALPRRFWHRLRHGIWNKYSQEPLKQALKDCFGERLLGESKKRLVIPSYNTGQDDIYLFKTPHHERLRRDYKIPIWHVALATSAAPSYFPCCQIIHNIRLIDGGVWANNPIMVGITEAVSLLGVSLDNIHVLSLGTTDEVKGRSRKLDHGGLWQWKEDAVNVVLRGQNIGAYTQALHLLGRGKIHRIDPKVPDKMFALDKLSEGNLLGKAAHESRIYSPIFKEMFMRHKAADYRPIYKM
ncbi:MAG: CBASS cGAMP-activated phospholipase [Syntrophaceae bacterium]